MPGVKVKHGQFRHLLVIQKLVASRDDATGETINIPETVGTAYGKVEPLSGRQLESNRALIATVTHRITCWYHPEIQPNRRFVFGLRVFVINSVNDAEELNTRMDVMASEDATIALEEEPS